MKWAQWYGPLKAVGFRNESSKQNCRFLVGQGKVNESVLRASVEANQIDGVERILAEQYALLVAGAFPDVNPIEVNLAA